VKLDPRGELCPLGGMFTPPFTPRGEHYLLFRRMEGQTENFTPRDLPPRGQSSILGDYFVPGGQSLSLRAKFAPRCEVKNGPLGYLVCV
jgi:hypothetical protein